MTFLNSIFLCVLFLSSNNIFSAPPEGDCSGLTRSLSFYLNNKTIGSDVGCVVLPNQEEIEQVALRRSLLSLSLENGTPIEAMDCTHEAARAAVIKMNEEYRKNLRKKTGPN